MTSVTTRPPEHLTRPVVGTMALVAKHDDYLAEIHQMAPGTVCTVVEHSRLSPDDDGVLLRPGRGADGEMVRMNLDEFIALPRHGELDDQERRDFTRRVEMAGMSVDTMGPSMAHIVQVSQRGMSPVIAFHALHPDLPRRLALEAEAIAEAQRLIQGSLRSVVVLTGPALSRAQGDDLLGHDRSGTVVLVSASRNYPQMTRVPSARLHRALLGREENRTVHYRPAPEQIAAAAEQMIVPEEVITTVFRVGERTFPTHRQAAEHLAQLQRERGWVFHQVLVGGEPGEWVASADGTAPVLDHCIRKFGAQPIRTDAVGAPQPVWSLGESVRFETTEEVITWLEQIAPSSVQFLNPAGTVIDSPFPVLSSR